MPDLTPMTRQEKFLNEDTDLEPITRREHFYAGREGELPEGHQEPETREEWFIKKYRGGGGGDITVESLSVTSNGTYTAPSGKAYSPVEVNVPLPTNAYLLKSVNTPTPIASFSDGEEMVMPSLKVAIEPQQEGSGDPSPTNIRPIIGWDEVDVTRTGKNLFDKSAVVTGKYLSTTTGLEETASGYVISDYIKVESGKPIFIPNSETARRWFYDKYKNPKTYLNNSGNQVFTATEDGFVRLSILVSGESAVDLNTYQIEYGSTATTYEPYAGTTTTIPFTDGQGQSVEVFGGSVDIVNGGEQPRTFKKIIIDENYNIQEGGYGLPFKINLSDRKTQSSPYVLLGLLSNVLKEVTQDGTWGTPCTIAALTNATTVYFKLTEEITTIEELKTYLSNNPIEIAYPLATPTTFYTQPTAINSLKGDNNLWANTGDIKDAEYFSKEV